MQNHVVLFSHRELDNDIVANIEDEVRMQTPFCYSVLLCGGKHLRFTLLPHFRTSLKATLMTTSGQCLQGCLGR